MDAQTYSERALHEQARRTAPDAPIRAGHSSPAAAAIGGFSGRLAGAKPLPLWAAPPPVLLVHGDADQVIPPSALFMSATALGAAGVPVQWHLSKGLGHGIDPFGLGLAGQFLVEAFSGRSLRTGPVATPFAR